MQQDDQQKKEVDSGDDSQLKNIDSTESTKEQLSMQRRELNLYAASFSGPLPHPAVLQAYEMTAPGTAEKLVNQAIAQGNHRMGLERSVIESDIRRSQKGLIFGFVLAILMIVSGTGMVVTGHDWAGAGVIGTSALGLVGLFVYGNDSRKEERLEKNKLSQEEEEEM